MAFEEKTQVFIVRIWFEWQNDEDDRGQWRGVIEHIPSGKRCYFCDLDTQQMFIDEYFKKAGPRLYYTRAGRVRVDRLNVTKQT